MKKNTEDWMWHLLYQIGGTFKGAMITMIVAFFIALLIMSIISLHK